jgi:predicted transcriptional regulator
MEGVIAVAAPFAMVVAIVWIVQQGKSKRAEVYRGRSGQDEAIIGAMQQQIDKLTDRVAVLERLVTDDDRRLAREIDNLRRDRPPV